MTGTDIGAPSDIFSVGTSLYCSTGALPFWTQPVGALSTDSETRFDPILDRCPQREDHWHDWLRVALLKPRTPFGGHLHKSLKGSFKWV